MCVHSILERSATLFFLQFYDNKISISFTRNYAKNNLYLLRDTVFISFLPQLFTRGHCYAVFFSIILSFIFLDNKALTSWVFYSRKLPSRRLLKRKLKKISVFLFFFSFSDSVKSHFIVFSHLFLHIYMYMYTCKNLINIY